jgi:lysophospholipase L1-like esterase
LVGRFLAACGILACAVALVPAAASAAAPTAHYYLALGDSLSVGYQPNASGQGMETALGYTNDLFAHEHRHVPGLKLVELGCPGETTGSMITGNGNTSNAKLFHCDKAGGSQLKAAERFLKAHHRAGEVPLVTIDIGANDVDGCADVPASQIGSCVSNGEAAIKHDLPIIFAGLRKAAPKGTTFASTTLYDPALADYFSTNSTQHSLWSASVSLVKDINTDITNADTAGGFKTADVAGAFDTYDTTDMVAFDGQTVPVDVARLCSWTWACTAPPRGPNIHANQHGYAVMAGAFEKVVGRLH